MVVGKMLVIVGVILVVAGVIFILASRVSWLGRLPGDIVFHRGNTTFYFPIVTGIVASLILSLILSMLARLFWK